MQKGLNNYWNFSKTLSEFTNQKSQIKMITYTNKIPASEVISNKIFTKESLLKLVRVWQFKSKKVVFTNGCFDILHRGHIDYLAKASDLGNKIIIGINSDASVKLLNKGDARPFQDQESRAIILASLHFVDAVVVFNEDTPYELIKTVQPDVLAKGADYAPDKIVGYYIVTAKGGRVIFRFNLQRAVV